MAEGETYKLPEMYDEQRVLADVAAAPDRQIFKWMVRGGGAALFAGALLVAGSSTAHAAEKPSPTVPSTADTKAPPTTVADQPDEGETAPDSPAATLPTEKPVDKDEQPFTLPEREQKPVEPETPTAPSTTVAKPEPTTTTTAKKPQLTPDQVKAIEYVGALGAHDDKIRYYGTLDRTTVNQGLLDAYNSGKLAFEKGAAGQGASQDITNPATFDDAGARLLYYLVKEGGFPQIMLSSIHTGRDSCPPAPGQGDNHCPADGGPGDAYDVAGSNGIDLAAVHAWLYRNAHELDGELIYGDPLEPGTHNMDYINRDGRVEDCDECFDAATLAQHGGKNAHVHIAANENPEIPAAAPAPQPAAPEASTPTTQPSVAPETPATSDSESFALPERKLQIVKPPQQSQPSDEEGFTLPAQTAAIEEQQNPESQSATVDFSLPERRSRRIAQQETAPVTSTPESTTPAPPTTPQELTQKDVAAIDAYVKAVKQQELNNFLASLGPPKPPFTIDTDISKPSGLTEAQLRKALQETAPALADEADDFMRLETVYGESALFGAAHARVESANGTSYFAQDRNNIFGFDAVDSNPDNADGYPNKGASIDAYGELIRDMYLNPDGKYFNGPTPHGIFVMYSSSHDDEANTVVQIMNEMYARAIA